MENEKPKGDENKNPNVKEEDLLKSLGILGMILEIIILIFRGLL